VARGDVAEVAADLALVGEVLAESEAVRREVDDVDEGFFGPVGVARNLEDVVPVLSLLVGLVVGVVALVLVFACRAVGR